MICKHCTGAGWIMSAHPDKIVELCRPCRGNGKPDVQAAPRRLSLRERVSYALVNWLCARRSA